MTDPIHQAVEELRTIRSKDPAAATAMATIRATILTLETMWVRHEPDD